MLKSASFLLCSFAVLALQGSHGSASQEKGKEMDPILDKLATIEGNQHVMQTKLLAVQSRLEAERISLMSKLEDQTTSLKSELDGQLKGQNTEIQSRLDSQLQAVNSTLEAQGSKLDHQLLAMQSTLKAQQIAEQSRLDSQLLEMQSEMKALQTKTVESILLAVQEKLDDHKADLQESLKQVITREDFEARVNETEGKIGAVQASLPALQTAIENQFLVLQNQSGSQQKTLLENLSKMNSKIVPPKFELIGSRYFYIEHNLRQNWTTAAASCRQMGGYLAVFRDEQEYNAITGKLLNYQNYWLGINDIDKEGEYVSVASGGPAPFLKWRWDQPNNSGSEDCVQLPRKAGMIDYFCNGKDQFICQWDNEI